MEETKYLSRLVSIKKLAIKVLKRSNYIENNGLRVSHSHHILANDLISMVDNLSNEVRKRNPRQSHTKLAYQIDRLEQRASLMSEDLKDQILHIENLFK